VIGRGSGSTIRGPFPWRTGARAGSDREIIALNPFPAALAAAILFVLSACSQEPQPGSATANAEVLADRLEAKADNYAMLADNAADGDAAVALENASATLDEESANLRAQANPNATMK
jgi:hypothetical protein